jgi:DNA-directed RNA polymerase subunit RPC12/RpoP
MIYEMEVPKGCLECNKDALVMFFLRNGLSLDVFKRATEGQEQGVIHCPKCGLGWMEVPRPTGERMEL